MKGFIYFVGKPYPYPEAVNIIKQLGYKVGIFQDINIKLKNPTSYDKVIPVDFSTPEKTLSSIASKDLAADGLICTYENYIMAKAQLGAYFNVPTINFDSAQKCTDKYLMRQAFLNRDGNITPRFKLVSTQTELNQAREEMRFPLIIKPTNLVKSLLVLRCNNPEELNNNFQYAQARIGELYKKYHVYDREPQLIVEEYVLGKTCSVAAFVDEHGEAHCCAGIVSLVNAQEIGVADNYIYARHLPGQFDEKLTAKFFEVARAGVEALGMTSSPAHVELIYNDKEVKIIEIGARIGGYRPRMYAYSYGLDLIEQEINLALGKRPNVIGKFKSYSSVFEIFPKSEGSFRGIEGLEDESVFTYFSVKPKVGDLVGPAKSGYKATAVVLVNSAQKQEYLRLCKLVDNIIVKVSL